MNTAMVSIAVVFLEYNEAGDKSVAVGWTLAITPAQFRESS